MTGIALYISAQVTGWLRSRATTSAVAYIALTGSIGIMDPRTAYEGCGSMTGMAIQAGFKVGGVSLGSLANRCTTVMTRSTIVHDTGMIKHRADKGTGVMTDATILVCWYMVA